MQINLLAQKVQQEAAQCVKCGLCLPHCPTYQRTQNECESPRGRIALMDGVARDQLPLTETLKTYLDHCLNCQACEVVCPAHVTYGDLFDKGRALIQEKSQDKTPVPWLLEKIILHPRLFSKFSFLLKLYCMSGLATFTQKIPWVKHTNFALLQTFLPKKKYLKQNSSAKGMCSIPLKEYYPPQNTQQGEVGLFAGCISSVFDLVTLHAAIKILTYCGYGVWIPKTQGCCGALHLHSGQAIQAELLKQKNLAAFKKKKLTAIVSTASGCTAVLQQGDFATNVLDISSFLNTISWPANLQITPLAKKIVLHTPCSLRNAVKEAQAPCQLLQKIPEISLITMTSKACCGAAGLHMVRYPDIAQQFLETLLPEMIANQPDYIVTSNIGCSLHFSKTLVEQGYSIPVVHPVTLLAQLIEWD